MLSPQRFVDQLVQSGVACFTGVPCSYLTPLINEVIGRNETRYVIAASEGEAVSIAAGIWLTGKTAVVLCQNSGLGNMVNPLTSLNEPFAIPVLLLMTWRGRPGTKDEPQHRQMGQIMPDLLDTLDVGWALLPDDEAGSRAAVEHALAYIAREQRPFALILGGETFSPANPSGATAAEAAFLPTRQQALTTFLAHIDPDAMVIATTGKTGRELFTIEDRPQHLYCVGSMGYASAIAHGVALGSAGPVYVLDGDGAALMHLGNLASIGASAPANLTHIILDNGSYDSTGGQRTAADAVDFVRLALAAGYSAARRCATLDEFAAALAQPCAGPRLLHVPIQVGSMATLGRPTLTPAAVAQRFRQTLAGSADAPRLACDTALEIAPC